ncbi:ferritin family protein [Bacillus sp. AK031]
MYYHSFHENDQSRQNLINEIQKAINGEYSAIICYDELSKLAKTREQREQILEIQQDEKRHFKEFTKIYKKLTDRKPVPKLIEECPKSLTKGLAAAFKDEQVTVDFYLDIAGKADNESIKETFRRAASDEQQHAVWFLYYLSLPAMDRFNRQTSEAYGAKGALNSPSLTLPQMLTFAMEDEYLAQRRYDLILNKFGDVRTFSRIQQAELRHIYALQTLFQRYGIQIPEDESYLFATVRDTIKNAYASGVQGEIDNIAMYNTFLGYNLPADIQAVFINLRNASLNHLEAFERGFAALNKMLFSH